MTKAKVSWLAPSSVTKAREALRRQPGSVPLRRRLAEALHDTTLQTWETSQEAALASLEEAVALLRGLVEELHEVEDLVQLEESISLQAVLTAVNDPERALEMQRESLGLRRYLIADLGPSPTLHEALMKSLHHLGHLLHTRPESDDTEAAAVLQEALGLARLRLASDPEATGRRRELANILHDLAALRMRADDPDAALALREEEIELRRAIAAAPEAWERDRERLARATYLLGAATMHHNPVTSAALAMQAAGISGKLPAPLRMGAGATGRLVGWIARRNDERLKTWFDGVDTSRLRQTQGRPEPDDDA